MSALDKIHSEEDCAKRITAKAGKWIAHLNTTDMTTSEKINETIYRTLMTNAISHCFALNTLLGIK